jgi:hypothetical protein
MADTSQARLEEMEDWLRAQGFRRFAVPRCRHADDFWQGSLFDRSRDAWVNLWLYRNAEWGDRWEIEVRGQRSDGLSCCLQFYPLTPSELRERWETLLTEWRGYRIAWKEEVPDGD